MRLVILSKHKTVHTYLQYEEYYQECLRDPVNRKNETTLDDHDSAMILKDYIVQWHLDKTFDSVQ